MLHDYSFNSCNRIRRRSGILDLRAYEITRAVNPRIGTITLRRVLLKVAQESFAQLIAELETKGLHGVQLAYRSNRIPEATNSEFVCLFFLVRLNGTA